MKRGAIPLLLLALAACARPDRAATLQYPATRTVTVVDDYHGTKVADPYRWLEDLESPEVRTWAKAQTTLTESQLNTGVRAWLTKRIEELAVGMDQFEPAGEKRPPLIDAKAFGDIHLRDGLFGGGFGRSRK